MRKITIAIIIFASASIAHAQQRSYDVYEYDATGSKHKAATVRPNYQGGTDVYKYDNNGTPYKAETIEPTQMRITLPKADPKQAYENAYEALPQNTQVVFPEGITY